MAIQIGKDIPVTVVSAEVGESRTKGTPGVFFKFSNDDGEIDGELYLSGGALERSINTLRSAFGFNDDFSTITEQCVGKDCVITTEIENYKGKDRTRVQWINPLRTANKPAAGNLLARLSAQAKGIARPAEAPKPNPKVTPKPAAPVSSVTPPDDGMPF
jgi:hypothetical protein